MDNVHFNRQDASLTALVEHKPLGLQTPEERTYSLREREEKTRSRVDRELAKVFGGKPFLRYDLGGKKPVYSLEDIEYIIEPFNLGTSAKEFVRKRFVVNRQGDSYEFIKLLDETNDEGYQLEFHGKSKVLSLGSLLGYTIALATPIGGLSGLINMTHGERPLTGILQCVSGFFSLHLWALPKMLHLEDDAASLCYLATSLGYAALGTLNWAGNTFLDYREKERD